MSEPLGMWTEEDSRFFITPAGLSGEEERTVRVYGPDMTPYLHAVKTLIFRACKRGRLKILAFQANLHSIQLFLNIP